MTRTRKIYLPPTVSVEEVIPESGIAVSNPGYLLEEFENIDYSEDSWIEI